MLSCAAVIVACASIGFVLAPGLRSAGAGASPALPPGRSLPPPPGGFAIPKPASLADPAGETRWAPVTRVAIARRAPSFDSPAVATVPTRTPEGTANLIVADGEVTRGGVTWVRAGLAVLPDGTTGWLPRRVLGGWSFVDTKLVVDRRRLTLTLLRAGRVIFRAPVGIGTTANPTPPGTFYVRDRLTSFASPFYGPLAFGTNARAQHLTDWPDGGFIGIHGTDEPQLIPGRISHGCIRLTNAAIERLGRLLPVGTPLVVT